MQSRILHNFCGEGREGVQGANGIVQKMESVKVADKKLFVSISED